jgi:membrane protein DedA with SNARE-associated domain
VRRARSALLVCLPPTPLAEPHLHLHHHLHGSSLGYAGIALAAAASWAGIPGPGEPVLIAGGIFAARGRLDLLEVLVAAWLGAMAGGVLGWAIGRRTGAALLSARGPFRRQRVAARERGERFFARFGVFAVYFAPSWVAGSIGMPGGRFAAANAVASAAWVALVGLGAYAVGPPIAEVASDIGVLGLLGLGVLVLGAVVQAVVRRRLRR